MKEVKISEIKQEEEVSKKEEKSQLKKIPEPETPSKLKVEEAPKKEELIISPQPISQPLPSISRIDEIKKTGISAPPSIQPLKEIYKFHISLSIPIAKISLKPSEIKPPEAISKIEMKSFPLMTSPELIGKVEIKKFPSLQTAREPEAKPLIKFVASPLEILPPSGLKERIRELPEIVAPEPISGGALPSLPVEELKFEEFFFRLLEPNQIIDICPSKRSVIIVLECKVDFLSLAEFYFENILIDYGKGCVRTGLLEVREDNLSKITDHSITLLTYKGLPESDKELHYLKQLEDHKGKIIIFWQPKKENKNMLEDLKMLRRFYSGPVYGMMEGDNFKAALTILFALGLQGSEELYKKAIDIIKSSPSHLLFELIQEKEKGIEEIIKNWRIIATRGNEGEEHYAGKLLGGIYYAGEKGKIKERKRVYERAIKFKFESYEEAEKEIRADFKDGIWGEVIVHHTDGDIVQWISNRLLLLKEKGILWDICFVIRNFTALHSFHKINKVITDFKEYHQFQNVELLTYDLVNETLVPVEKFRQEFKECLNTYWASQWLIR